MRLAILEKQSHRVLNGGSESFLTFSRLLNAFGALWWVKYSGCSLYLQNLVVDMRYKYWVESYRRCLQITIR